MFVLLANTGWLVNADMHMHITSVGQSEEYQHAVMFSAASTFRFGCVTLSLTALLRQFLVFWLHQVSCGRGPQSLHLICAVFSSEHTARGKQRIAKHYRLILMHILT